MATIYRGIPYESIQAYKRFYDKNNNFISTSKEHLMPEEIEFCLKKFDENPDFDQISNQTLIVKSLVKDIYFEEYFDKEIV